MKRQLNSLRLRMLLPVVAMILFVVILLTAIFSRAYTGRILRQEQENNAAGFETVSGTVTPLVNNSIAKVRSVMQDSRVVSYARLSYSTAAQKIRARVRCRDYLQETLSGNDGIFGLLFMRPDGSFFGSLPKANLFLDDADPGYLPEEITAAVLAASSGQTVWAGPVSAAELYGDEKEDTGRNIMIAAWRSVDISYGECYAMLLMDESVFTPLFSTLQDGKSTWRLFTEDGTEFFHTGAEASADPEQLIRQSNSGSIYHDADGLALCSFSAQLSSPAWTVTREVSMEDTEQVVGGVRRSVFAASAILFLIALGVYELWLKGFMRQFRTLVKGINSMGQSGEEPIPGEPFRILEFQTMQGEINRTSLALNQQMDTIRRMEREQAELENRRKEQERMAQELSMAKEIQRNALPHIFPPFPHRKEFDLYASMDPARNVGGDFYDFYFIDRNHLCLLIADVSGKGIPAAMFMMVAKRVLEDAARREASVSEILQKTNEALLENNQTDMFVTVWLAILDVSTGQLTAANAGHEPPVLRRRNGRFELFRDVHGFVIAGMENVHYKEYSLQLEKGDKLFVYTDGVPEATSADGEMFGMERMVEALNAGGEESPEGILQSVRGAVDAFVGDAEQFDDLTMMCLEYKGPAAEGEQEPQDIS